MFDPLKAFSSLNGRSYSDLKELRRALGQLRWDHITELPVDYGVRELMDLVNSRKWLVEDESGKLFIRIRLVPLPKETASTTTASRKIGKGSRTSTARSA